MGLGSVNEDLQYLRRQAKHLEIQRWISCAEYENCLVGLNNILIEAWQLSLDGERRWWLQALSLAKKCYSLKLDLLSSATIIERALKFVDRNNGLVSQDNEVVIENDAAEKDLDGNTTLLVETGDAWFNGMYMRLPKGARFEIEMQWGAIGWSVPASFGYAMGMESDRRIVSIIGDGSFQLTAQEVANMIRYKTNNVIFLVNNHGYVIESEIHEGPYNYFKNWGYAGLVHIFNAEDGKGLGLKATTSGELAIAIKKAREHRGGPILIECQIAHDDCTPQLLKWGKKVAAANGRPPVQV